MVAISPCMNAQGTVEFAKGHLSPLGQYTWKNAKVRTCHPFQNLGSSMGGSFFYKSNTGLTAAPNWTVKLSLVASPAYFERWLSVLWFCPLLFLTPRGTYLRPSPLPLDAVPAAREAKFVMWCTGALYKMRVFQPLLAQGALQCRGSGVRGHSSPTFVAHRQCLIDIGQRPSLRRRHCCWTNVAWSAGSATASWTCWWMIQLQIPREKSRKKHEKANIRANSGWATTYNLHTPLYVVSATYQEARYC